MSTISVNIFSYSQQFERSMKRAERSANEFSRKTTKSFQGVAVGGVSLGKLATVGGLAIFTKKIGEAAAALVNMASDAAEAEAAFTTTFGPAVDGVNQFVDEMANKILAVLEHKPLQKELVSRGQSDAFNLTWSKAAEKCLSYYQRVLSSFGLKKYS